MASLPQAWTAVYPFTASRFLHEAVITMACFLLILCVGLAHLRPEHDDGPAVDTSVALHADRVHALWTDDTYQCIAWRSTASCSPHGRRKPSEDRPCTDVIEAGMSGFCEIRNRTSGEIFQVMLTACDSVKGKTFSCMDARAFTDFSILAAQSPSVPPPQPSPRVFANTTHGIVMSIYPSVLPNVYAIVRMLRFYNCLLPMELWYEPHQMPDVETNPILMALAENFGPLVIKPIDDARATGYMTKPFAVAHSQFDSVLFLDSDNLPTRDPTFLFTSAEFVESGAIFWPDYWHQASSPFNVHPRSLLWQLVDMPFVDMMEQESGQLVIDRRRCAAALAKVLFYALEQPQLLQRYGLVWGDKDLFRLAWVNTSTPFAFMPYPPALGGFTKDEYVESLTLVPAAFYTYSVSFCGIAMLQHDFDGRILFVHRNSVKLTGDTNQPPLVTHAQSSTLPLLADPRVGHGKDYVVHLFGNTLGQKACYTLPSHGSVQAVDAIDEHMAKVEKMAIHYAIEAGDMLRASTQRREDLRGPRWLPFLDLQAHHVHSDVVGTLYWLIIHAIVGGAAAWIWRQRSTEQRRKPDATPHHVL
ncbi:hypothetical protein ACHHYP_12865 [Achlya hypogyna]|uniref:Nucleotide-diphospho-sugar transferase n=1 Tax=Achlya hypogyna TaxID=1202772 RepID=A0A1V9ZGN3_ACHHY|nr:hypothetical protein ACHHYP_12865 [Achlya hypogyna]